MSIGLSSFIKCVSIKTYPWVQALASIETDSDSTGVSIETDYDSSGVSIETDSDSSGVNTCISPFI